MRSPFTGHRIRRQTRHGQTSYSQRCRPESLTGFMFRAAKLKVRKRGFEETTGLRTFTRIFTRIHGEDRGRYFPGALFLDRNMARSERPETYGFRSRQQSRALFRVPSIRG